jgi:selenide, water dikinase
LCGLEFPEDPNLLVGLGRPDDAGVYKLRDDLAIIQTVDFFTPIVDDPYMFGQIAAANALSDVYAMGGRPLCAMNIAGFPVKTMDIAILREILRGGLDKMREAGVVLAGGHTVEDKELKYGLSVTGVVHPEKILTNLGARPGDRLILTKPLGTGILTTAVKAGLVEGSSLARLTEVMATLNRQAAELMSSYAVHACTDVTGFGLIGHACEMIEGSPVGFIIQAAALPLLPGVEGFCEMGLLPAGLYRNREFREAMVEIDPSVPRPLADVVFDPQTSGGLLIALTEDEAKALLERMHREGVPDAAIIGEVVADRPAGILVR